MTKQIEAYCICDFAELLFNLKPDQTVEFALEESCYAKNGSFLKSCDVQNWWFAKRIQIEGYQSDFILIDYCGGGMANVISLTKETSIIDFISDTMSLLKKIEEYDGVSIEKVYIETE